MARISDKYTTARTEAQREFRFFKNSALFMTGLVAYLGSGDKVSKYWCKVSSSDPALIKIFVLFLRSVCSVPTDKIKASLLLYPSMDEKTCLRYWVAHTGLPASSFGRSVFTKTGPKSHRLAYGLCNTVVSSRYLKEKMLVWLRLVTAEFADMV